MMSSTYCPTENKLRLYSSTRLDEDTYQLVKAAGFKWAPKQDCFFAQAWSPAREDLLIELCEEIGDEDISLVERAADRAERFDEYHDKRLTESTTAHQQVKRIADIVDGAPILVGHHSERHARKDAERIESGIRKAVNLWETAQYWQARAKGALRHATYKESAPVRARRIKGLEADLRKQEKNKADHEKSLSLWQKYGQSEKNAKDIANYEGYLSFKFPLADYPRDPPASQYEGDMGLWSALDGGVITAVQAQALALPAHEAGIAYAERWIAHLTNRLTYERALLADAGGTVADQTRPEKGGACMCWASPQRGWSYIVKVNKISVSVLDNWGNGGANFTRVIPFDKLSKILTAQEVQGLRETGFLIETSNKVGFYRRGSLENLPAHCPVSEPSAPEAVPTLTPATVADLKQTLKAGVQVVTVPQLFPTPPALATHMVKLAAIQPGDRVLEPSAGTGRLLDAIGNVHGLLFHPDTATVAIEHNQPLALALAQRGYARATVTHADFLTLDPAHYTPFDVVLMNPPFHGGADIQHVTHALRFLAPGGRLVAIMSASVSFGQSTAHHAFRALLDAHAGTIDPLPDDTFSEEGSQVRTVLVQCRRPATALAPTPARLPTLAQHATGLSSGTMATLTGETQLHLLENIQNRFALWCARQEDQGQPWQDAWAQYWPQDPAHPTTPPTLATLATAIATASTHHAAQVQRDQLTAESRTKRRPTRAQAPPVGLFAQTQGQLF